LNNYVASGLLLSTPVVSLTCAFGKFVGHCGSCHYLYVKSFEQLV